MKTATRADVAETVARIVAGCLGCDVSEVNDDSLLIADLGAEGIDFLDLNYQLRQEFEIDIPRPDLIARDIGKAEAYVADGRITDEGIDTLIESMPFAREAVAEFAESNRKPGTFPDFLRVRDIQTLMYHLLGL